MEPKLLRDVLPDLQTNEYLTKKLDHIYVTRLLMPHDRHALKIFIRSDILIPKREIYILQAAIKKQFFERRKIRIEICESFDLGDIPVRQSLDDYRESILLELKENNLMDYHMFRHANIHLDEGKILVLEAADTAVNRKRGKELSEKLTYIINERMGYGDISVRIHYGEFKRQKEQMKAEAEAEAARIEAILQEARAAEKEAHVSEERSERASSYRKKYIKGKRLDPSEGFGRDFEGEPLPISSITQEIGEVVIEGEVFSTEGRTLANGKMLVTIAVTDHTDSIQIKYFAEPEEANDLLAFAAKGEWIILKGLAALDNFDKELTIRNVVGIKKAGREKDVRMDNAPEKRVELHLHTKMSDMDGVSKASDIVMQAARWGHKAVAITDHGVVQAYKEAYQTVKDKKLPIKLIYGCEGYLVDDTVNGEWDTARICRTPDRYHIILLAKNEIGRENLYKLVSESHLTYFGKRPRIPKSLLSECREGLIIGSACEAGEVFRAVVEKLPEEEIGRRVKFYDYLEIQPVGNNQFMIPSQKPEHADINNFDDLRELNKKIAALAEKYEKPLAATCDVHFLNPEDEIYRRILQKGMGFKDADTQPPLYLHTTEEMLEEFSYLGEEKAFDAVVKTPNLIADCCEFLDPVRPDKCPPVIEGSEDELRNMCYEKAHSIYGDPLPEVVEERLSRELHSIISNGFAVMYIIAERLVKKSNDDGYLVGSRGSVGSSFAATMSGITEVNPLPPHYVCPKCKYSDFESEQVKAFAGGAGCDMPDAVCPHCGTPMKKDGFDIPFETFLGFKGDKEPDIDLNFSGEYQSHAHAYTEVLFGTGNTFRAGTIATLAEKTAYGYVLKYYEEKGEHKRRCEIERIAKGCEEVRRSTGQHPGGIVVMPHGENIYSFTPIQHPANDMTTSTVTTHFDYHFIDHNLLKLDILGHDDPTMIRKLEDLTGLDATEIPLDSKEVMSLFQNTEALKITPDDIGGTKLGALGVPEFGTDFAMQMLIDAKPTCFSDLVRIAGLAHGTDVWLGNAQDLILSGTATIQTAICTRDDIMTYLISKGVDKSMSFSIMENVRKGKVAKGKCKQWPEWKSEMQAHDVPDWYIGSCEKIAYMFPKAHAAAYVMMAWRIAYCKVFYPLAYYAAYFSIRGTGFNYELMGMGRDTLKNNLANYRRNQDNLTDKEKLTLRDMRIAEEMYARGIEFMPIDIYRAKAKDFQIIDGKIMPSFMSIEGMGEKAAMAVEAEAVNGKYISVEDFVNRTRVSKSLAEYMAEMGIFGDMPRTNQISLFDLELM